MKTAHRNPFSNVFFDDSGVAPEYREHNRRFVEELCRAPRGTLIRYEARCFGVFEDEDGLLNIEDAAAGHKSPAHYDLLFVRGLTIPVPVLLGMLYVPLRTLLDDLNKPWFDVVYDI